MQSCSVWIEDLPLKLPGLGRAVQREIPLPALYLVLPASHLSPPPHSDTPPRCCGQHRGEDEAAGVCSQQEEGAGPPEPEPLHFQRSPLLVRVSDLFGSALGVHGILSSVGSFEWTQFFKDLI